MLKINYRLLAEPINNCDKFIRGARKWVFQNDHFNNNYCNKKTHNDFHFAII